VGAEAVFGESWSLLSLRSRASEHSCCPPLPFVSEFGLATALGIVVIVGVALATRRFLGAVVPPGPEVAVGGSSPTAPRSSWRVAAAVVGGVVALVGMVALPQLDVETRPDQLARGLAELKDAEHAESVLRSSAEVSIVLRGRDVTSMDALDWMRRTEALVVRRHGDQLHPAVTLSGLLTFLGPDPTAEQVRAGVSLLPPYLTSAVLRADSSEALMTFGLELRDLARQRTLLADLRSELPRPPDGYPMDVVGLPVAAVRGLALVSEGRGSSTSWASSQPLSSWPSVCVSAEMPRGRC